MEVSDQIIQVLDDLCNRFGVAVDWADVNVVPYMSQLCERFVKFEIYTSIFWMALAAVFAVLCVGFTFAVNKKPKYHAEREVLEAIGLVLSIFSVGMMFIVVGIQAYDIIEACTIPEKVILDYVLSQAQKGMP